MLTKIRGQKRAEGSLEGGLELQGRAENVQEDNKISITKCNFISSFKTCNLLIILLRNVTKPHE